MTIHRRLEVLNAIMGSGLIPIFFHEELHVARRIINACTGGGARVIEFTNRGDGAWQVFAGLLEHCRNSQSEVMLGGGSIVDAATAALYVNNGADFIVGPTFNVEVAELCNRRKVAYIPGCGTLTEISNAEVAGIELVKIFPGDILGPEFVKAVHGPQPWTNMIATGGVSPGEESIMQWFDAGVSAVGIGSGLIRRDWIMTGQYHKITKTVSLIFKWIGEHRSQQQEQ